MPFSVLCTIIALPLPAVKTLAQPATRSFITGLGNNKILGLNVYACNDREPYKQPTGAPQTDMTI